MPFDSLPDDYSGQEPEKKQSWPPARMWSPHAEGVCTKPVCAGEAFGPGEPCNLCGRKQDGSLD